MDKCKKIHHFHFRISEERFKFFTDSIIELFPEEIPTTWFSGSTRDFEGPKSARGILYSKYKSLRNEAEAIGRLERKNSKRTNKTGIGM